MESLEFIVVGSKGDEYVVKVEYSNLNIYVSCTCQAGKFGKKCRHKMELLSGRGAGSSEEKMLAEWCERIGVDKQILEIVQAEKQLESAKKHVESLERALSRYWVAP